MKYFLQIALCLLLSNQLLQAQMECYAQVNVSLDGNGEAILTTDVLLEGSGNPCTNCQITVIGVNFDTLASGPTVTLTCDAINRNLVYFIDDMDNSDFCFGDLIVEDKLNVCNFGGPAVTIAGLCDIGSYDLLLNDTDVFTEISNCIRLIPSMNNGLNTISINHSAIESMNGVSTLDLVIFWNGINDGFQTPMHAVLSDVDNDGTVSSSDLINTRRAILGYPNSIDLGGLRIFDTNDPFTGFNPFGFTEDYQSLDFDADYFQTNNNLPITIRKLGDLNDSAIDSFTEEQELEDRSEKPLVYDNINLFAGETYIVSMNLNHTGIQALTGGITIEGSEIINIDGLSNEGKLISRIEGDMANVSFLGLESDQLNFTVEFKASSNGLLSDFISLNEIMFNELVDLNMEEFDIVLEPQALTNNNNLGAGPATMVFPNPTSSQATILFSEKFDNANKTVRIFNSAGTKVFDILTNQSEYIINKQKQLNAGFYIIEVQSSNEHSRLKLIIE